MANQNVKQSQNVNVKVIVGDTHAKRKPKRKSPKKQPTLADIPVNTNINNIRPPNISVTGFPVVPQTYRHTIQNIMPDNPMPHPAYFEIPYTNKTAQMDNLRSAYQASIDDLKESMSAYATNAQHLADIESVASMFNEVGSREINDMMSGSQIPSSQPSMSSSLTTQRRPDLPQPDYGDYPDEPYGAPEADEMSLVVPRGTKRRHTLPTSSSEDQPPSPPPQQQQRWGFPTIAPPFFADDWTPDFDEALAQEKLSLPPPEAPNEASTSSHPRLISKDTAEEWNYELNEIEEAEKMGNVGRYAYRLFEMADKLNMRHFTENTTNINWKQLIHQLKRKVIKLMRD